MAVEECSIRHTAHGIRYTAYGTRYTAYGVHISRHAGVASARTLRLAAVSRWVSSARGQPLDVRLRKASSPTYSFRVSIRIYLFLLTKTLNSIAERTDVFARNCKDKKFNQLLFVLIVCIFYCPRILTINYQL